MRQIMRAISLAAAVAIAAAAAARADEVRALAVFDFELINSSLEPDRPDELQRLAMLGDLLRQRLAAQSDRFRIVDAAPLRERIARAPALRSCNGCDLDFGRTLGADLVVVGTVQKVSNLILNINVAVKDVGDGAVLSGGSVDVRGNTDESWQRGLDRLLRRAGLVASGQQGAPQQ
jgi:hypothetical protein